MSDKRIEIVEELKAVIDRHNDYLDVADTWGKAEEVLDYILGGNND